MHSTFETSASLCVTGYPITASSSLSVIGRGGSNEGSHTRPQPFMIVWKGSVPPSLEKTVRAAAVSYTHLRAHETSAHL
eukprot:2631367-Alexandrium_andersonii.AAC.1